MKKNPIPQGKYIPASRYGNLIYTSGMTPRDNGVLMYKGKIKTFQPIEFYKEAVRLAASNALLSVVNTLSDNECIDKIVTLTVFIAAEQDFQAHAKIADFAAEYLYEELGKSGIGSRAAIGVATLPGDSPIEIQLIAAASIKKI